MKIFLTGSGRFFGHELTKKLLALDDEAINDSDIIVFLVAHDEFKGIRIFGKEVFDFCGVTNDNSMI